MRTRDRIMDVALTLFAANGVRATPVTSIEAAAGLSAGSGSFYRHFPGKAELLTAVVDRELERVSKDPSAQVSAQVPDAPPAEALALQLRSDLDFLNALGPLIAILIWERDNAPDVVEKVRTTMTDRGIELGVADLLLCAPAAPVADDPVAAAAVMQSAVVGYHLSTTYFGSAPAGVDADRFTATLARLLTA